VPKLLLASNNQGKLIEIQTLLRDLDCQVLTPAEMNIELVVDETGQTYHENAAIKAHSFEKIAGILTLADDTGLEVDALDGLPGLHSARFSPKANATDSDRRAYLLEKLRGKPRPWTACFRCITALATSTGNIHFAEGVCVGEIIPEERGARGFGYDPIFLVPELNKTMAEITLDEKNRISHRARAIQAARPMLVQLLDLQPKG
jgi:XTP/dITP diphosphohydrolase